MVLCGPVYALRGALQMLGQRACPRHAIVANMAGDAAELNFAIGSTVVGFVRRRALIDRRVLAPAGRRARRKSGFSICDKRAARRIN